MANAARGEVDLVVDGVPRVLRLTLGGMAELETRLGVGGLAELVERFETDAYRADDLIALLAAGLRGGGFEVSDAEFAGMQVAGGAAGATRAAAQLLIASFAPLER
ncbi:Phage tail tube protein, GTA-gp10 [Albimonas donghaensis]|uniref:Phage tail tube protein, GTA-gp10 n=1 Tax=Albimonas donghaensis TaxID=356660 RepID=A0A1H2SVU8_9RHOB|nr:gene transfer agent family protein [Albimonas donghaensis]SDW35718.1 Phage tail tube protein, GTA-gp10 [Albimonas donghaensis]